MGTVFRLFACCLLLLTGAPTVAEFQREVVPEYGGFRQLQMISQANLPEPGQGEVRVMVLIASASFTNVLVRRGLYAVAAELPYPLGYYLVDIVDKVGTDVGDIEVVQRVASGAVDTAPANLGGLVDRTGTEPRLRPNRITLHPEG